ncbi:unnamed protein product [Cuscuta epithymum]|uniref:EamA domain-containing protein n=1 Tax=Cuscuta epithymum TaxID=186058 RepID=A0AAV0CTR1_9ASTE|nr:unnamed protein product [Cuscuta epithymum]
MVCRSESGICWLSVCSLSVLLICSFCSKDERIHTVMFVSSNFDMWAAVIRIFFYKQKIDWLYYLAFGLVVIGLVVYSKTEKGSVSAAESEDGLAYEILDGECTDARKDNADVVDV